MSFRPIFAIRRATLAVLVAACAHEGTAQSAASGAAAGALRDTVPTQARAAGIAELPRELLVTSFPQVTGRSIRVRSGGDLQDALDRARRGDEVVIDAGAAFRGTFTLGEKPGTAADGWIVVRSSRLDELPAGRRVTPAQRDRMARLVAPDDRAALRTALGASGWYVAGLEVTAEADFTGQQNGLVLLGSGGGDQRSLDRVATDLVLDRMYIHGLATTNLKRCVALNSARTAIIESWLDECHGRGFDSQAIAGWNGPGPFRITNNYLAGAGENVMFGGADPAIPDLVPADIELRRNHIETPIEWKGVWQKKNLLETKNATRLLVEGNVIEGSWKDGQVGFAMILKSANQSGRCTWCRSTDITIRRNIVRKAGAGFNFSGREGSNPHPVGERLARVVFEHNIVDSIGVEPYVGDPRLFIVQAGVDGLVIRRNTLTTPGRLNTFLALGRNPARNMVFADNVLPRARWGLAVDGAGGGPDALRRLAGQVSFTNNAVLGRGQAELPPGTRVLRSASDAIGIGADREAVMRATEGVVVR